MDDALLEAHAQLRRATYRRHPGYVDSEAATESIRAYLRPIHEEGRVAVHEEAGRVTAVLAWRHQEDAWVGEPVSQVAMDLESAPEHFRAATLDAELPRMEADLDLMLDAHHRATLEALLARGLGVDSIQLLGEPTRARAKLEARPLPPGITVTPLEAPDVEATLALHRETFAREPVYCWFGANPGFLASFEERLRSDREGHFVVRRDGVFAGHVSAAVKESPFWGRAAGMDLVLAPALRGRGLLRGLYASLLDSMIEAEARVFKGGTSQPPVLRLAREMDRTLFAIHLRRGATLPHAAFEGYL